MTNRTVSLFQLEALLAPPSAGKARRGRAPRRGRKHPRPPRRYDSPAVAQSFDTGAPIRCEHAAPVQPTDRLDVPKPPAETELPPLVQSHALDISVEAFDEPYEEEEPLSIEIGGDEEDTSRSPSFVSRASDYETVMPGTFAAQMDAVERDLAELATRVQTPPAEQPAAAAAPASSEDEPPPVRTVPSRHDHSVFDAMAKQMHYATEFRLPAVQLSQVFSALDKQLDAELEKQTTPAPAPIVVPPAAKEPEPSLAPVVPPNGELLKDLVAMEPRKPAETETPVIATPVTAAAAIDVRHDVQLVPQLTGFSCWAAGAAMLVAWRDRMSIDPSEIANATGYWAQYAAGLHPEDTQMFRVWRLTPEAAQTYTVQGFADLLRKHGPLWVASAEPGPHIRVVTGMVGDGTPTGTLVYINDPWAQGMKAFKLPNAGSRYTETYQRFVEKQETLGHQERRLQGIYVAHN